PAHTDGALAREVHDDVGFDAGYGRARPFVVIEPGEPRSLGECGLRMCRIAGQRRHLVAARVQRFDDAPSDESRSPRDGDAFHGAGKIPLSAADRSTVTNISNARPQSPVARRGEVRVSAASGAPWSPQRKSFRR